MINAIEVFNEKEWYPIAMDWCINKDLAVFSNSDIHGIISEMYDLENYHRPKTLVLATERTENAVREALFANRTIAYYGNILAGKEEYLKAFFDTAIEVRFFKNVQKSKRVKKGKKYIIKNSTDVPFEMNSVDGQKFTIPANGETIVVIPDKSKNSFEVKNLFVEGTENLVVALKLK